MFALHTWDLWSVAPAAAGLAAAASGRRRLAGALFGLGAAVKWWPALLVVVLLFGPWAGRASERPGRWSGWQRLSPGLSPCSPGRCSSCQRFSSVRGTGGDRWHSTSGAHPTRMGSTASWGGRGEVSAVAVLGRAVYLCGGHRWSGGIAGRSGLHRKAARATQPRSGDAALSLIVLFMLTSKVVSPQFILWLLPVAVISSVSWQRLLVIELPNAAVWYQPGRAGDPPRIIPATGDRAHAGSCLGFAGDASNALVHRRFVVQTAGRTAQARTRPTP